MRRRALRRRRVRVGNAGVAESDPFTTRHAVMLQETGSHRVRKQARGEGNVRVWGADNVLVRDRDSVRGARVADDPSAFPIALLVAAYEHAAVASRINTPAVVLSHPYAELRVADGTEGHLGIGLPPRERELGHLSAMPLRSLSRRNELLTEAASPACG